MRIGVSGSGALLIAALATVGLGACGTGALGYPTPRRLVVHSGERIAPTAERMEAVEEWVREQVDSIREDPSFLIISHEQDAPAYPWETLQLNASGDTAHIWYQARTGTYGPYLIYAHLHIMDAQNRLDRWLPELAPDAPPFQIERAILSRVADSWLHQRSVFDARPNAILDEIVYAKENSWLDAFILTARPDLFVEERREWHAQEPDAREAYAAWFRHTFEREPPGMRGGGSPPG